MNMFLTFGNLCDLKSFYEGRILWVSNVMLFRGKKLPD